MPKQSYEIIIPVYSRYGLDVDDPVLAILHVLVRLPQKSGQTLSSLASDRRPGAFIVTQTGCLASCRTECFLLGLRNESRAAFSVSRRPLMPCETAWFIFVDTGGPAVGLGKSSMLLQALLYFSSHMLVILLRSDLVVASLASTRSVTVAPSSPDSDWCLFTKCSVS